MEAVIAGIALVVALAAGLGVRLYRRRRQSLNCEHCADQKAEIEHPIS